MPENPIVGWRKLIAVCVAITAITVVGVFVADPTNIVVAITGTLGAYIAGQATIDLTKKRGS